MRIKKLCVALAAALAACCLVSCADTGKSDSSSGNGQSGSQSSGSVPEAIGEVDTLVKNFWDTEIMQDESILLVAETDENGSVTAAPKAKLLLPADEILSVKQYYHVNNNGIVEFEEGKDFVYENGYIVATGSFEKDIITGGNTFKASVPFVTDKQLTGEQSFPGLSNMDTSIPSTDEGLYLPFTESYQIVQMQLSVSYKHAADAWTGTTAEYLGETLSKTVQKLKNKETVELFMFGDSISTGANSSGVLNIEPFLKTFPELVAENLSKYYGAKVNLTNKSVGGFTSDNGLIGGSGWMHGVQVHQPGLAEILSSEEYKDYSPDIALLGFGMNDASLGVSINTYCGNLMDMIEILRERNPDCEIILIGTMLANPKAKNQAKNQAELSSYLPIVAQQAGGEGIAVVDIGKMHKDILDAGKNFTEISANNVNHPNDFITRLYAMNLLSALIDYDV